MNALGTIILIILIVVILLAPRRWAVLGMMAGVLYLTMGQAIELLGLNLFAMRFLEIAGFVRVVVRREFSFSNHNRIDQSLLLLYSYTTVVFLLRSTEGHAYQIGLAVDAILCYFTFRGLIRSIGDFKWFLRVFLVLLIPYVVVVSVESLTAHNPFAFIGGSANVFSFRDGRPRCMGSFRHPILLGTLGASFLPIYIGFYFSRANRLNALIGIGLCLAIVWLSNSGGALNAAAVGFIGWLLWIKRKNMFMVRRSIVGLLVLLALIMKAPVWYLFSKISSISGGDGWHRSYLIDVSIQNLNKWWLAGMPIGETRSWFPYNLTHDISHADITNQYIGFGLSAGIVAIALFILLLTKAFQTLGKALNVVRSDSLESREYEYLLWGLGVMLSVHIVNWLGVSFFDQIYVIWFMQLATISSLSQMLNEQVCWRRSVGETIQKAFV